MHKNISVINKNQQVIHNTMMFTCLKKIFLPEQNKRHRNKALNFNLKNNNNL